jgi:hypothetical protein
MQATACRPLCAPTIHTPSPRDNWTDFFSALFAINDTSAPNPRLWECALASNLHAKGWDLADVRLAFDSIRDTGVVHDNLGLSQRQQDEVQRLVEQDAEKTRLERNRREAEAIARFVRDALERIFFERWQSGEEPQDWEGVIACRLLHLDYTEAEVRDVLDHCRRCGSAGRAPHLSEGDRRIVDGLIPDDGDGWDRAGWAAIWALNM